MGSDKSDPERARLLASEKRRVRSQHLYQEAQAPATTDGSDTIDEVVEPARQASSASRKHSTPPPPPGLCPGARPKSRGGGARCSCFSCAIKKIVDSEYFGMSLIVFLFILSILLSFVFLNRSLTFCRSDGIAVDAPSAKASSSSSQSVIDGEYDRPLGRPYSFADDSFGGARFKKSSEELERHRYNVERGGQAGAYPRGLASSYPSALAAAAAVPATSDANSHKLTEFYMKLKKTEQAVRNAKEMSKMSYEAQPSRAKRSLQFLQRPKTNNFNSPITESILEHEINDVSVNTHKKDIHNQNDSKSNLKLEHDVWLKQKEKDKHPNAVQNEPKKVSYIDSQSSGLIFKNEQFLFQFEATPKPLEQHLKCITKTRNIPTMPSGSYEKQQNHPFFKNSQRLDNILDQFLNINVFPISVISPAMRDKYVFLGVVDEPKKGNCKHPQIPQTQEIQLNWSTERTLHSPIIIGKDLNFNKNIADFTSDGSSDNKSNRQKHENKKNLDSKPNINLNRNSSLDKNVDDIEKELKELIIYTEGQEMKMEVSEQNTESFELADSTKNQGYFTKTAKKTNVARKDSYFRLNFSNNNRKLMGIDIDEDNDLPYGQNNKESRELNTEHKRKEEIYSELDDLGTNEENISYLDENIAKDTQDLIENIFSVQNPGENSESQSVGFGKNNKSSTKGICLNITRNASEVEIKPLPPYPPNVTHSNTSSGENNTLDIKITIDDSDEESDANKTTTIRVELVTSFPIIETENIIENQDLHSSESFDDAKNRFGEFSQDYSDYGVLEDKDNQMLNDKKKIKDEHKKTQRSSDKQLKGVTDNSVGSTKEKTFYFRFQPNTKEELNSGGIFKHFRLNFKSKKVSETPQTDTITDNSVAYKSLVELENELSSIRNKREHKSNLSKNNNGGQEFNAYKQLEQAIDEKISEKYAENGDIFSQAKPRYCANKMITKKQNNQPNFKTRSLLSVNQQNYDVISSENRVFSIANISKFKENFTFLKNIVTTDAAPRVNLSLFDERKSLGDESNVSLENISINNESQNIQINHCIDGDALGSGLKKNVSRNKREFSSDEKLDTLRPQIYMKDVDYDKYFTTKMIIRSSPPLLESNYPEKYVSKADLNDKIIFATPFSQEMSSAWQASKSGWIRDKWKYMNEALKRPALTIDNNGVFKSGARPQFPSRNDGVRKNMFVARREDEGIFSKMINAFHSPNSEVRRMKRGTGNKKSLMELAAKLDATCARAAAEVRMVTRLDERASGDGAAEQQSAELMQQLVRLMGELVDYQVQQKTCRKLPSDLQDFLMWLTDPLASGPPPLELSEGSRAESENVRTDDDLQRAGDSGERKEVDHQKTSQKDTEQTEDASAAIGGAGRGEELAADAASQLRELLRDYGELSEDEKSQVPGVRNYLLNQLSDVQNVQSPAAPPPLLTVSLEDMKNGPDRYKRDALTNQKSSGQRASAESSTKHTAKKRAKNFQGRTRSKRRRRKINKFSKYFVSKFGKVTSASEGTKPTAVTKHTLVTKIHNASKWIETQSEHAAKEIANAVSVEKGKLSKVIFGHSTVTPATKKQAEGKSKTTKQSRQSNRVVQGTEWGDKEMTKVRYVRSETQRKLDREKRPREESEEGFEVPSILRFQP